MNVSQCWFSFFFILALMAQGSAAVSAEDRGSAPRLKLGGIYGLTGFLPEFGDQFLKGSRLYLEHPSSNPGRLSLQIEDSRWDPATAVSAFQKLATIDGVQAVYVMGSGPSLAIKPLSESCRILLLSAGAHPQLIPGSSLVIRHGNLASEDAESLAAFIHPQLKARAVVGAIFLQNDWGISYQHTFEEKLKNAAGDIKIVSESHLPADTDFRAVLLRLFKASPAVVVINSAGIAIASIIEQARQLGYKGRIYVNNGLSLSAPAQRRLRSLNEHDVYYQRYPRVPEEFAKLYAARYGKNPDYFSLIAFTDLELLDYATGHTGPDAVKIVHFIKHLREFRGRFVTLSISPEGDILIPTSVEKFE